ncbi:MAG: tryptophan synthase subunit alpha [Armatimonadota bacterium]
MTSRIQEAFARAKAEDRGALMPYLTAGDPSLEKTVEILQALQRSGADLIELGIPYSDPLADGPVIQSSAQRALAAGTKVAGIVQMVRRYREGGGTLPIVLMTCYNPIISYGPERFAADFAAAGADGVLITDLPPTESEEWGKIAADSGLATVFLVSPTTPPQRIHLATERTTGFVYAVSRAGVTGARADLPADLATLISNIRANTSLPVAVGFGVSTADQVRTICRLADGAIVGSALVKIIGQHAESEELLPQVEEFVRALASGKTR